MLYQTYLTATFDDSFLIEADSPEDAREMALELFTDTTGVMSEGLTYEFTNVEVYTIEEA
jgi:hypothetical protein